MIKLVTFSGYDARTGPHIFPIEADVNRTIGHIKMARPLPPEIEQYIRDAKPIPGKTQLLIDAMGAGEYYGSNVNGDYFPEEALRHKGPDYGHETFMHYAYPYKHHVNKDPARAYGDKVTLAAYDPHMHRVLLIVRVDDSKCQDILTDLANGNYWDVSMGCKVPWDQCSICKNKARTRAEYCPHLRYQMNKILQDGRRVFAYNWKPKFFDISFVTIGAEKASHVLKKVAYQERPCEVKLSADVGASYYGKIAQRLKRAAELKKAEIEKEVPASPSPPSVEGVTPEDKAKLQSFMNQCGDVKEMEPSIPTRVLDRVAGFPTEQIFATIARLGIDLKPHEFQRIILIKQGQEKLANQLERQRLVFNEAYPSSHMPAWAHAIERASDDDLNEKIALSLKPYLPDRCCYPEPLLARIERFEKRGEDARYVRDSQWRPMSSEQMAESSGMSGTAKASMALAAGYIAFKRAFPRLIAEGPNPVRAIYKYPWLVPILMGAGVGAIVGLQGEAEPLPLRKYGGYAQVDANTTAPYHRSKVAGINPLASLGAIPLAYIYSGIQQKRWERGAQLNAFDRFAATRPDVLGLAAMAGVPRAVKSLKGISKVGGALGDMALYTVGTRSKLMPAVLVGAAIDSAIFRAIQRLASKKERHGNS